MEQGGPFKAGGPMKLSAAGWLFVVVGAFGCAALAWLDSTRHFRRRQQQSHRDPGVGPTT